MGGSAHPGTISFTPAFWLPSVLKGWLNRGGNTETLADDGRTLLMVAVQKNDLPTVKILLDRKAKLEAKDDNGDTALILAARARLQPMAVYLMERGSKPDETNRSGATVMHFAAAYDEVDVLKKAVALHGSFNKPSRIGITPLARAILNGRLKTADYLLSVGAKFADADYSPMHYAALVGAYPYQWALLIAPKIHAPGRPEYNYRGDDVNVEKLSDGMIHLLAKHGMKVNDRGKQGRTPLHVASLANNQPAIAALLACGADPKIKDDQGKTADDLANDTSLAMSVRATALASPRQ